MYNITSCGFRSFCQGVSSVPLTLFRGISSNKRLIRKPLKKFRPTSSLSQLTEVSDLESEYGSQALSVAIDSNKRTSPGATKLQSPKQIYQEGIFDDSEKNDYLPPNFDKSKLPKYEKILGWDKHNPLLKSLKAKFHLIHSTRKAGEENLVVLEGKRLINEALKAGIEPQTFVFSRLNLLAEFPLDKLHNCQMVQIPYKNISAWSELKTSPGFMATFKQSDIESVARSNADSLPISIVLDNIRVPDNVGALLRTAAAVGCRQVISMLGCAGPWNPKTLRSGAGAHLRVPISSNVTWDSIHRLVPATAHVVVADLLHNDSLSSENSANVYTKLKDLDMKSKTFRYEDVEANDYKDFSYHEEDLLQEYRALPLPTFQYDNVDMRFCERGSPVEVVVVIGGETHGVSSEAYKFAHQHSGERVFIPLRNSIDSLNAASAASVILFEFQKKMLRK